MKIRFIIAVCKVLHATLCFGLRKNILEMGLIGKYFMAELTNTWVIYNSFIENEQEDISILEQKLDQSLQQQNSYYFDLIEGKVLQQLKITKIKKNGFKDYMKSIGKLGGQNKIPRLSNDRKIANGLTPFKYL